MSNTETPKQKKVRKLNTDYRTREHLTPSEVDTLLVLAQSSGRNRDRDYALVLLMYRHGLRATEAGMLRWDSIDFEGQAIYIRRLKKSISGTHPLQSDEVEALKALKRVNRCPYVFVNEKGESFLTRRVNKTRKVQGKLYVTQNAIEAPGISKIIERLGDRLKDELGFKIHAHMLRHACGYYLANQGYDVRAIQDYLGHANIQHTVRYTALASDRFNHFKW